MTEKRSYRKLESTKELQRVMTRYYGLSNYFRYWGKPLGRKLAWVTSGAPVELLRVFNIHPVYPEQYGAICGSRKVSGELCQVAEAQGYNQDLCSYARAHIGSILRPDLAPMKGLPKPDLLVACTNICGTVLKWYEALARILEVPLIVIDTPYLPGEVTPQAKAYVLRQLEAAVEELERLTGVSFSEKKLDAIADKSRQVTTIWREIKDLCAAKPSPLNAPDLFIHMAPIVVLRGTDTGIKYYSTLKKEVEQRVQDGVGALEQEKVRLVWDNIAIWPHLFRFFKMFSERGACFVADTYTGGWAMEFSEGSSMETLATTYTEVFLNRSAKFRARQIIDQIRQFDADGFVMHSNRSCKPYSLVQEVIRRQVMQETGVPGLMVEADMADPRAYAEEPTRNRVQAFLETLGA
jgi:bcr-type benzoyl-CoA reductase subunit B